ncbi:hypothetical protein FA15DRAFT_594803 [Coprinopsis marcescibilis]|uniref:Uncharacterized protein n=1 Tax=Coprinopsis marcescibilis TaxID=230819 RepID=A0A5C3KRE3_COPMA|nr:hypothetical protein FA15DRAFT_594803 [Coprinopsis marcescibilis]
MLDVERQASHSVLRDAGDQLNQERRRAEEATYRVETAERREKEALGRLVVLERMQHGLETEMIAAEQKSQHLQVQLELSERELKGYQRDISLLQEEFDDVKKSLRQSQEQCRKYRTTLRDWELKMDNREKAMQIAVTKAFDEGDDVGYDVGFKDGHSKGKIEGKAQGIKAGRQQGLLEGKEQGRLEERRNALDAIDKFLAEEDAQGDSGKVRRWAQSVYYAESQELETYIPLPMATTEQHRRKGPKDLPKLPASAFVPPNSATEDSFPLGPDPSTVQPEAVIDANVIVKDGDVNHTKWKKDAGQVLGGRIRGVVLSLPGTDLETINKKLESSSDLDKIVSLIVPFNAEKPDPALESQLSLAKVPTSLSTVYTGASDEVVAGLKWALERGRPVDVDVQVVLTESTLEGFEDTVSKATEGLSQLPPIILSNILPPPHDLDLPIIRLMNHPSYLAFQSQVAALSLLPSVYIKFLPPAWDSPTPQTPYPGSPTETPEGKVQREWKRRIKMYLGPVLEAFGYQRIIFGSSPSTSSAGPSNAGDWYEIARESLAELVAEQEFVDAVFYGNALTVYGPAKKADA